jgi:Protein of unknown function (DUF2971)
MPTFAIIHEATVSIKQETEAPTLSLAIDLAAETTRSELSELARQHPALSFGQITACGQPSVLYHYSSGDTVRRIVESNSIWASSHRHLNDSKEIEHGLDIAEDIVLRCVRDRGDPVLEQTIKHYLHGLVPTYKPSSLDGDAPDVYIASFCSEGDLLSQWRSYCPPSDGFSVGIDSEALRRLGKVAGFELEQCVYEDHQKVALIRTWTEEAMNQLDSISAARGIPAEIVARRHDTWNLRKLFALVCRLKHRGFRDEREWRLIGHVRDQRVRQRPDGVPYVPIELDLKSTFANLWVGPRNSSAVPAAEVVEQLRFQPFNPVVYCETPFRPNESHHGKERCAG